MQERLIQSNSKNYQLLDIVEILSVVGSISGAIASVVSQQIVFASIPLSLSVTLNLVNRRLLLNSINHNQTEVAQLIQENVLTQAKLGTLTEQLAEVQQLTTGLDQATRNLQNYPQIIQSNQTAVAQLIEENIITQAKLGTLTEQLAEVQQLTTGLGQASSNLQNCTQSLREQTNIEQMVEQLREIETCTQTIRINPKSANSHYKRGFTYQQIGDNEGAVGDYTEAIRINSSYAEAYLERGRVRADLGDKKGAVEDLREAAKLFFEKGDIANYQTARDLSKKMHDLGLQPRSDAFEEVALECLFG